MIEAIVIGVITLFSAAAIQAPTHYIEHDSPKPVAVFVPPHNSDIYVSDAPQTHAPLCVEYCNQKGEPQ